MDHYAKAGFRKFIICVGNLSEIIQDFICRISQGDANLNTKSFNNKTEQRFYSEPCDTIDPNKWDITVVDTGIDNMTGSRVAQIRHLVDYSPLFCLTYGDTVSDINLHDMLSFHLNHKKIATLLAVNTPTRFRILGLYGDDDAVRGFAERSILQNDYINGGFYIFNNSVFNLKSLRKNSDCTLETDVLEELVGKKELCAFRYTGFWQYVDTERDRQKLCSIFSKEIK